MTPASDWWLRLSKHKWLYFDLEDAKRLGYTGIHLNIRWWRGNYAQYRTEKYHFTFPYHVKNEHIMCVKNKHGRKKL